MSTSWLYRDKIMVRVVVGAAALVSFLVLMTGSAFAAGSSFVVSAAMDTKEVHMPGDYFAQPVIVVHAGDTVTWINDDSVKHSVVSFPGLPVDFHLELDAGKSGTFKFDQPGVYRYYSDQQATYDEMMDDAKADDGTGVYPAPMRGAVVVLDGNDSLPASSSATIDIPGDTMNFTPWALVVKAGDTVTWTNHDDDMMHMVSSVPDHAAATIPPITLPAATGTGTFTFTQAGVYYYYCPVHASYDADEGILYPLESYGMFPYLMDGIVIVTSN